MIRAGILLSLIALSIRPMAAEASPAQSQHTRFSAFGKRAGPDEVIARERRPGFLAAYDGAVAWSSYDARTRRYRLKARVGGRIRTLPIASARLPFDVDLGPGPNGDLSAVYARCPGDFRAGPRRRPPEGGRDCDVFQYDFKRRRERRRSELARPGHDELLPTIWRGRVAFARTRPVTDHRFRPFRLFVSEDAGRPRALRGGSQGEVDEAELAGAEPTRLDLRGRRLAFSWTLLAEERTCPKREMGQTTAEELWLVELGVRRRRLAEGCQFDETSGYADASLTTGGLYATMVRRYDDRPVLESEVQRLTRFAFSGTPLGEVDLPTSQRGPTVDAAAQDGPDTYFMIRERAGRYTVRRQRLFE